MMDVPIPKFLKDHHDIHSHMGVVFVRASQEFRWQVRGHSQRVGSVPAPASCPVACASSWLVPCWIVVCGCGGWMSTSMSLRGGPSRLGLKVCGVSKLGEPCKTVVGTARSSHCVRSGCSSNRSSLNIYIYIWELSAQPAASDV